jgi:tetratricopeptide (TPR) repeat protein
MICRISLTSILLILLALPGLALAQEADPRAQSRAHFEQGIAHLAERRFDDAVRELEAARSLYATASIHFNLGLAYRGVGRARDAISAFERFLTAVGETGDPARVEEVNRYLRTLRASLVGVRLDITPADARVTVDGEPVPRGTTTIQLDPGAHVIAASAPGHRDAQREIQVEPGSSALAQLALERIVNSGTLVLDVDPNDAAIRIDGRPHGVGDQEIELEAGAHALLIEALGRTATSDFELATGQRLDLSLAIATGDDLTWLWVVLGVVIAGGAAAAVTTYFVLNPTDQPPRAGDRGTLMTALVGR